MCALLDETRLDVLELALVLDLELHELELEVFVRAPQLVERALLLYAHRLPLGNHQPIVVVIVVVICVVLLVLANI